MDLYRNYYEVSEMFSEEPDFISLKKENYLDKILKDENLEQNERKYLICLFIKKILNFLLVKNELLPQESVKSII